MTIETYPASPVPGYNYVNTQRHRTLMSTADSGAELRRRIMRFPKRAFSLKYKYLSTADRNTLFNFFTQRGGGAYPFWFIDCATDSATKVWQDEYVGRGGPLPLIGAIAADATVFTDETVACRNATANGMTLLPATPAVNDAYYFGSLTQFDKITITMGTQGNGVWTIVWEYWDGDSWDALAGVADGTNHFEAAVGDRDVTFTRPDDWVICTPPATSSYSCYELNAYWVRARVSAYTSKVTQPKASGATVSAHTYDLHCVGGADGTTTIYLDGTLTANYNWVDGGGAAGADRITLTAYPAVGTLITSNFTGRLRIKGRFSDELNEQMDAPNCWNIDTSIQEIQW